MGTRSFHIQNPKLSTDPAPPRRGPVKVSPFILPDVSKLGILRVKIKEPTVFKYLSAFRQNMVGIGGSHSPAGPLPGLENLACGYDTKGSYGYQGSLKLSLLDLSKCSTGPTFTYKGTGYDLFDFATASKLDISKNYQLLGESARSMQSSLSVQAGLQASCFGFEGEIEFGFANSSIESMYNVFNRIYDLIGLYYIKLDYASPAFKKALSQEFLAYLDDPAVTPESVFERYGTHFTSGIVMGGKLCMYSVTDRAYFKEVSEIKVAAQASFPGVFSANASLSSASSLETYQARTETSVYTMGGDVAHGGGSIVDQASYQVWKDSVAAEPAFVDFTEHSTWHGLSPVWELAKDSARRDKLKKAAEASLAAAAFGIDETRRTRTYVVTTVTSSIDKAGTDGDIWLDLRGQLYSGKQVWSGQFMHDDGRNNHEKGDKDSISFALKDIGEPNGVKIYNNGEGAGPDWHLKQVEILCLDNGAKTVIPVNSWIEDGQTKTFG